MRRERARLAAAVVVTGILLGALTVAVLALRVLGPEPFAPAAPDVDAQAREIAKVLKCPVCENIPVADSPSDLAQQMRELIHKKVEAGETREQILAYFAERYGDDILLDPPKRGVAGVLWFGPLVIVASGAFVVGATMRHWHRQAGASATVPGTAFIAAHDGASIESLVEAGGLTVAEQRLLTARLAPAALRVSGEDPPALAAPATEPAT